MSTETENYPGELAMLRGLLGALRVTAQHGDLRQVQQLLTEHERDEQDAYAEAGEKRSRKADATPGPTGRAAQLLDAITTSGGRWTTNRACRFYRQHMPSLDDTPGGQLRTTARGDLRELAAWGHLIRHEEPGRIFYVLKARSTSGGSS